MPQPTRMRSSRWAMAVLTGVMALSGACGESGGSGGGDAKPSGGKDGKPAAEMVALQAPDLPPEMKRCDFTGEMEAHIAAVQGINPRTAAALRSRWQKQQIAGATSGYVAYYGSDDETCGRVFLPPEQRMVPRVGEMDHRALAFTFVVEFRDEAAAKTAYEVDLFGQSNLKKESALVVTEGITTGLGPNSISSTTQGSELAVRQAVWQNKTFNVFFGSTAMDLAASQAATRAVNSRID